MPPSPGLPATPARGDPDEIERLLSRQDRVVARRQLRGLMTEDAIDHLVRRGVWQRAGWGVIVARTGPLTQVQQLWAACLAAGDGAVIGGATAAALEGLRGHDRDEIHIVVPARRRVRATGVMGALGTRLVVHRTSALPASDVRGVVAPPRTVIARSIVDAAAWAVTDDDARAIVAAAYQQRRVAGAELRAVLRRLPRSHRRALVLETLRNAERGAETSSVNDQHRPVPADGGG